MSSIGLCSKGLILILWSDLVLEGFQCAFEFVKSFRATSKHGTKVNNPRTGERKTLLQPPIDEKKTAIPRSDCFFTRILFFPDRDAIAGLFYKDHGENRPVVSARASLSSDTEKMHTSHLSNVTEKNAYLHHHLNDPSTSGPLGRNEEGSSDGARNVLPEKSGGDSSWSPVKRRGALEEMILCLNEAVTSIDVCVLVLTCDRLTAPLLRAKARGVRVRVLLDRSMAAVEGSSLPQLRRNHIPVRLLPSDNCNSSSNTTNNTTSQNTRHTYNGKTIAVSDGDAELHDKLRSNRGYYNGIECNKSAVNIATTSGSSSSGLMHHKFAVIDATRKPEQKTENLGHVAERKNLNDSGRGDDLLQLEERFEIGGITTRMNRIEESLYREGRALVITGSFNWTWSAVANNNENIIISNRPDMVAPFSEQFEKLWREAC